MFSAFNETNKNIIKIVSVGCGGVVYVLCCNLEYSYRCAFILLHCAIEQRGTSKCINSSSSGIIVVVHILCFSLHRIFTI